MKSNTLIMLIKTSEIYVVPGLDLVQTDWFFSDARPWNGGDTLESRLETSA